eukprot:597582-Alexandrium_andersonii.AAC.1
MPHECIGHATPQVRRYESALRKTGRVAVRVATYNVQTLIRANGAAEVLASELAELGVDVCGLQETRA